MSLRNRFDEKKKARQYRREMRELAERDASLIRNNLKPKPKWVPWPIWMWGISIFIETKRK